MHWFAAPWLCFTAPKPCMAYFSKKCDPLTPVRSKYTFALPFGSIVVQMRCFAWPRLCFAAPWPCFAARSPYFASSKPCLASPGSASLCPDPALPCRGPAVAAPKACFSVPGSCFVSPRPCFAGPKALPQHSRPNPIQRIMYTYIYIYVE